MGAERAALKELAELFRSSATLYAVGGFSRSLLLGVPPHDIDICSKLTLEDVKKLLSNTRFAVSAKSMRLMGRCQFSFREPSRPALRIIFNKILMQEWQKMWYGMYQ